MQKVVRLGTTEINNRQESVFCKIEYKDGRLSISGVEGPRCDGNAAGVMRSDQMDAPKIDHLAPGWTEEMLKNFWYVWHVWHLNDMHPECEHQRALGWTCEKKVKVRTWTTTMETYTTINNIKKDCMDRLSKGETVTLSDENQFILMLPDYIVWPELEPIISGYYKLDKEEEKSVNWVSESEHPEGLLSKPCPVCGYKYGHEWKSVDVPADVIEFLKSLPDTDLTPAWI